MPTVTRVLPWRRHQLPAAVEVQGLITVFRQHRPKASCDDIVRAYAAAAAWHEGQSRQSGEPYVTHPLAVATICARLGMDETTIIAALLHDAVEDTDMALGHVETEFGRDAAELVDGVTKLDRLHFDTKEAQQAATIRKMLVATAKDVRVLVIKLADRLHNMRTIAAFPAAKQEATARETAEVYAPLAHRLGMGEVKQQLEDLCFAALQPKVFAEIDHMVAERAPERELLIAQVEEQVREALAELGVKAEVTGRPKHLWSIYEKMVLGGKEFSEIYDLVGLRVVVNSEKDCYAALGTVHSLWRPVSGRFKDYISLPKFNFYQSLHTSVVGPQGKNIEVQIRTAEMHRRAETGVAAHFAYKEGRTADADLPWLSRVVDWQQELSDPDEFMANLKIDLEQDEVFCFTPKGDVIALPAGATPVDFAYAIHTEVGHRCIGARVDGKLVRLDSPLNSGVTVEIFTSKVEGGSPNQDWLSFVATRSAATKIKQWFSRERREDAQDTGSDQLVKAIRREGLPTQQVLNGSVIADIAAELNFASVEAMLAAIGEKRVSAESVAGRISRQLRGGQSESEELVSTSTHRHRRRRPSDGHVGVNVEGFDDLMVRMARCCAPVPPDEIVGYVTKGRGVSVHRADCANALSLSTGPSDRVIDVSWDDDSSGLFTALIEVKALDRSRLLTDITSTLSDQQVNILVAQTQTGGDRVSTMRFEFELGDPSHLENILGRIRQIDSVFEAYRVVPGRNG